MSQSLRKKKESIFCKVYFVQRNFLTFLFYLDVQCNEHTFKYIYLYQKKLRHTLLLLVFKIVKSLQCILNRTWALVENNIKKIKTKSLRQVNLCKTKKCHKKTPFSFSSNQQPALTGAYSELGTNKKCFYQDWALIRTEGLTDPLTLAVYVYEIKPNGLIKSLYLNHSYHVPLH